MHKRQQRRRAPGNRDVELRAAHQRAFEQIRKARASADERRLITEAIEALIDACEAYTMPRRSKTAAA